MEDLVKKRIYVAREIQGDGIRLKSAKEKRCLEDVRKIRRRLTYYQKQINDIKARMLELELAGSEKHWEVKYRILNKIA